MHVIIVQWNRVTDSGVQRFELVYGPVDVPADPLVHDDLIERYREAWRAEYPEDVNPHISVVGIREPI